MRRRLQARHSAAAWVLLMIGGGALAGSVESAGHLQYEVRKLRDDTVALYRCHELSKPARHFSRAEFLKPWIAVKDPARPQFLQVIVDGEEYCVKAYLVETNAPVPATKTDPKTGKDGECKAQIGKQPKPAYSRGVGEGC